MSSLVGPPCWIVHQHEGEGIVADMNARDVMWRDEMTAMVFYIGHMLFQDGFCVQRIEDSEDWKTAAAADGRGAVWIEEAVFGPEDET
jgi:hypothetical protein